MPPSRHIRLTEQEDARLREVEQAPYFKPKVPVRAQVLRLSHRGSNIQAISAYTGRSRASVGPDLDRFEERGFEGLFDGAAPGSSARITEEVRTFVEGKLSEERARKATQLAEVLREGGLRGGGHARGPPPTSALAGWATRGSARATYPRYVPPTRRQIPSRNVKPERSWKGPKGGGGRKDRPEVPRRERLLVVPASLVHLDAKRGDPTSTG
jgi:hypothetical protein